MIYSSKVRMCNKLLTYLKSIELSFHVFKIYVEEEVLVSESCMTLCDPMDCSPQSSSVHGALQARIVEWVAISLLQGIFLIQVSNPGLPHCRQTPYHLSHQGS